MTNSRSKTGAAPLARVPTPPDAPLAPTAQAAVAVTQAARAKAAPGKAAKAAPGQAAKPAPGKTSKAPGGAGGKAKAKDKDKDKAEKDRKPKLVRDSFTIPKAEYAVLEALKQRAAQAGAPAKKSEVLRAGIKALASLTDDAFLAALAAVPSLKTGRPAKQ